MKLDISQAKAEFDKYAIIISPPRTGSNNLSFMLHIQDNFFAFSERVDPGWVWFHDCMGNSVGKQCDLPEVNLISKLQSAKTLVWKKNSEKIEVSPEDEEVIICDGESHWLNMIDMMTHLNTILIPHFRHPALVFRSCAKMYSRTGEEEWNLSPAEIVEFFINQFKFINLGWTSSNHASPIAPTFQEDFIRYPDKSLEKLLFHLRPPTSAKLNEPEEHLVENYGKNATNVRGYGYYNPLRKVSIHNELSNLDDELKLHDIDFIDEISKRVRRELKLNNEVITVLDMFVNHYRDTENLL